MTELKSYKGDVTIPIYGTIADTQVYLKAEADLVIAEKDKIIDDLKHKVAEERSAKVDYKISARDLSNELRKAFAETCHQKYKRCLAMASYWLAVSYQCVDDKHRQSAKKHRRKWLELANKFKEAK